MNRENTYKLPIIAFQTPSNPIPEQKIAHSFIIEIPKKTIVKMDNICSTNHQNETHSTHFQTNLIKSPCIRDLENANRFIPIAHKYTDDTRDSKVENDIRNRKDTKDTIVHNKFDYMVQRKKDNQEIKDKNAEIHNKVLLKWKNDKLKAENLKLKDENSQLKDEISKLISQRKKISEIQKKNIKMIHIL